MIDGKEYSYSKSSSDSKSISILITIVGILLSVTIGVLLAGGADYKYLFVAIVGLVAFIITFTRLELGVLGMIIALYTQAYLIIGERYGITDIVQYLIILLVFCMVTRWVIYTPEIPQGWMRPLFYVGFYCLVCLASVMFAEFPSVSLPNAVDTLKSGVIALIIAVVLSSKKSYRLAIWGLLFVGIFLGTLSVIQFTSGTYSYDYGGYSIAVLSNISGQTNDYRLGGPVGDPNYYAQMMLVLVPLALDRMWSERKNVMRFFAILALGLCSFAVLLTYSRGGFISMVIVVSSMIFIFRRGQIHYLLPVAVVVLLLINILPAQFTNRISTLTELIPGTTSSNSNGVAQDLSLRGRMSEAIVAVQMFADHPVLGVGVGNYPYLYQQYARSVGLEFRSEVRQAHDLYLEIASETGLLGLFSFLFLIFGMIDSMWKAHKLLSKRGLTDASNMIAAHTFALLGFLISALFIHAVYFRNFWVIAGIALASPRMAEIEIENAEKQQRNKRLYR